MITCINVRDARILMCVCLDDNLKSIADTCFLLGKVVLIEEKSRTSSHVKVTGQGHFKGHSLRLEASRLRVVRFYLRRLYFLRLISIDVLEY